MNCIRLIIGLMCLLIGCSAHCGVFGFGYKLFGFVIHNDGESDLYETQMLSPEEEYVYFDAKKSPPIKKGEYSIYGGVDLLRAPKYLKVRWKQSPEGGWIEKIIDVRSTLPRGFWGNIYVSVLPNNKLALSWEMDKKTDNGIGAEDCGGYIFEHYKAEADKKIAESKAWLRSYQDPKYWDEDPEVEFRCNIRFYL